MAQSAEHVPEDQEYDTILNAVMETPRGRWFMEEYARRNRTADTSKLLTAIGAIGELAATAVAKKAPPTVDVLRLELQEMSASIQQTRSEIAAIKPSDAGDNRIMAATGELDAIVTATERATGEILAAAERIQEISEKLKEQGGDEGLCDELEAHSTDIFMACSFQDITGQRTTKVVQVLQYLEQRVNSMINIWGLTHGDDPAPLTAASLNPEDKRPDAHLLNGPQSEEDATSQDEVDAMLNGEMPEESSADAETAQADDAAPAEAAAPAASSEEPAAPAADVEVAASGETEEIEQGDIDAMFD